ncbi:MAG: VOC family protein [Ruminococcaceae bacterium]|nr:VOC family protein [Oscillospiraceae bacterium]
MKIEHITINTAYLDASVAFYRDVIGLEIRADFRKTGGMPIVFLSNGEGETCIELIENKENVYSGSGLSIGFHVNDVNAAHELMTNKGFNPTPMISPNPNVKFFFIKDPNGVNIQFM